MRYVRESKISYITGIICVSLLFICTSIINYVSYSNYVNGPVISDEVQLIERDKYTIDIKYPVLKNNEINKDIKDFIRDEKKLFKDSIKDIDTYENELNISYNYSIKDNLYGIVNGIDTVLYNPATDDKIYKKSNSNWCKIFH